jgi:transcriptional regulator of acetoin/glycerol metabolism
LLDFLLARRPKAGDGIEPGARQALLDFAWPGNVRQMRNVLRTLAALCDEGGSSSDLPAPSASAGPGSGLAVRRRAEV